MMHNKATMTILVAAERAALIPMDAATRRRWDRLFRRVVNDSAPDRDLWELLAFRLALGFANAEILRKMRAKPKARKL